jgi:hypothetical protein
MVSDDWTFSVPASVFSGSVTGDQIDLSSFQVSGTVNTRQHRLDGQLWWRNG